MRDVKLNYAVTGGCGSAAAQATITVTSNEPGAANDIQIVDAYHLRLRSERLGTGSGRVYTITITASIGSSSTTQTVFVRVPHDRGHRK
jgi:hypothetical protein